jgi:ABC-type transporter Mla MlaB component
MRKAAGTKRSKASKPRLAAAARRPAARRADPSPAIPSAAAAAAAVDRIELPAGCTLRDAAALKTLLAGSTCSGTTVTVEGGAVARIDTAGLQLLAAFALREKTAGRQLEWHSASDELRAASARIGLSPLLQLPPGDAA